ncbi:hypothetical protein BJX68DRAFT_261625 [Aspergillus pseudodeflectus]|uniref:DUF7730 domain-containing protein n=1 Tax=Aspergillus pseudodeflectus TaxID=176178 RepID=A0ABR4L3T2_9EURO
MNSLRAIGRDALNATSFGLFVAFLWLLWLGMAVINGVYYICHPHRFITMRRLRGGSPPVTLSRSRRSLTTSAMQAHPQQQSLFFKLPPELRQMVYREALIPRAPIHVRRTHRRLCSTPCGGVPHSKCAQRMAADGTVLRRLQGEAPHRDRILPLLRTCRGIYFEAVDLIYTANTLFFEDLATLAAFPRCVTPDRLSAIQCVRLDLFPFKDEMIYLDTIQTGWQPAIDALVAMHGLVDLAVRIPWSVDLPRWELYRDFLLGPLKEVTAARRFVVELPPSADLESNVDGVDGEVPYTIVANAELQVHYSRCNWWGGDGKLPRYFPPL